MVWTRLRKGGAHRSRRAIHIDAAEGRVFLSGSEVALSPLLLNLLTALAGRPDRLIPRRELKALLWPYAERIDTERRLNTAMRALRRAIGDEAATPRFVETVRGKGYRWIDRRPAERRRLGWATAALAMLVWTLLLSTSGDVRIPAAAKTSDVAELLRAQAAVDQWRQSPTAATLRQAASAVALADRTGSGPAIHVLKGNLALEGRWDWQHAEREFRTALALEPGNADARLALAWLHSNRGRVGPALNLAQAVAASADLTEGRRVNLGWLLIRLGRPDLAQDACQSGSGASINALACLHMAQALTGRFEEARATGIVVMRRLDAPERQIGRVAAGDARAGYARFLDWRVAHFLPADAPRFQRAQILADAGRTEEALASLATSVTLKEPLAIKIWSTPSFTQMRTDPRFRALAVKVGLPA